MRHTKGKWSGKVIGAGVLIAILVLAGMSSAAEKKFGRQLTLTLKDERTVDGELLSVIDDRLVLYNAQTSIGSDVRITEVSRIRILKGHLTLAGMAVGALGGALCGAAIGSSYESPRHGSSSHGFGFSFDFSGLAIAGGAIMGGLAGVFVGGGIGSAIHNDESIDLETTPRPDQVQVLRRLNSMSRNPSLSLISAHGTPINPEVLRAISDRDRITGNTMRLFFKDGTSAKGELVAVKDDRLTVFNDEASSGADIAIGKIQQIRVYHKKKIPKSALWAGIGGAAIGALIGSGERQHLKTASAMRNIFSALKTGTLCFSAVAIVGSNLNRTELINLQFGSSSDLEQIIPRLRSYARITDNIFPNKKSPEEEPQASASRLLAGFSLGMKNRWLF